MLVPAANHPNELPDDTEFILPTPRVNISHRWQQNLGPSPQTWATSPLRELRNWVNGTKMGDLTTDGLSAGFYGCHSRSAGEGVVRVFDPHITPGVDVWTYGYLPDDVPMGSGSRTNKGYAEMWGGNVKTFPDERQPIGPLAEVAWTEHIYSFWQLGGLDFANADLSGRATRTAGGLLRVAVSPTRPVLAPAAVEIRRGAATLGRAALPASLSPLVPAAVSIAVGVTGASPVEVRVVERGAVIAQWTTL